MQTYNVNKIRDHFVITENGHHILVDTGCPIVITNANSNPWELHFLADIQRNVDSNIAEVRGMTYLTQHKVLFDYDNAQVVVADPNDNIPIDVVAEFDMQIVNGRILFDVNIGGVDRTIIFDTGASITDYLSESIARTGMFFDTIRDFHPDPRLKRYTVERFALPVQIGNDTFHIPFGLQPAEVETDIRAVGADGVIGVGLYKKYKVLFDFRGKKLILGR
jgi:hypothetical protein